ncbi:MAG: SpoIIE family protein phosphatase [Candidatus Eremiobacteraeota bacterium]|nr:SpoIIE family protein phosphatase [Candidatus Eremiobacteraeota bacterium]
MELPPGSLLVLYTDGVTEATHDLIAGEERLRTIVASAELLDAPNIAEAIDAAVVPAESNDDVALLTMELAAQPVGPQFISRWSFDASDMKAVALARREYVADLERRVVNDDDCGVAQLVLAELLGNVVRHAPGCVDIALDWACHAPVLHVLDRGNGFRYFPKLPADLLSECGRGLFIVSAIAEEFVVSERPGGGCHARALLPNRLRVEVHGAHTPFESAGKSKESAAV